VINAYPGNYKLYAQIFPQEGFSYEQKLTMRVFLDGDEILVPLES
jgi:hypothetical protein